jgi:phenylpropionate dioxygenase-like ring-hydroxylating dioxygenase large terminal subunit
MDNIKIDMSINLTPPEESWHPQYEIYEGKVAGTPDNKRKRQPKQPFRDLGTHIQGNPKRYFSQKFMRKEWKKIWTKTWILAGHLNDIPKKDRFMKFDVGKESFIIVRGDGDKINAFYNVCQHRGTRLEMRDYGSAKEFTCPYHFWRFSNKGKLVDIAHKETFRKEALCRDLDIPTARVESWRGWIFLTMNPDAMPLQEFLGEEFMALGDAYKFEDLVRVIDVVQEWPVNWKIGQEAFIEGYHAEMVHPELARLANSYHTQLDVYDNGHSLTIFPFMLPTPGFDLPEGYLTDDYKFLLNASGVEEKDMPTDWRDVRAAMVKAKRENQKALGIDYSGFSDGQLVDNFNAGFFPNSTFNSHAEGSLVQKWMPHPTDPEKMYYIYQVYALAGAKRLPVYFGVEPGTEIVKGTMIDRHYADPSHFDVLGPVLSQDRVLVPRVAMGNRSDSFQGPIFSELEVRIRHFYDEYYKLIDGK